MPITAMWGFAMPAAQALMTRQVTPHEQGRLQGAIGSLASVAGIIGPLMFTRAFAEVTGRAPAQRLGRHHLLAGRRRCCSAACVLAWRSTRGRPA